MYKFVILALCVASAIASQPRGIVDPITSCGGEGTPLELRVSDCEGRCQLVPGTRYDIEGDIIAASDAESLNILVDVIYDGVDRPFMDVTIPNSAVEAGKAYTIRYQMTPTVQLAGREVYLRFTLYHTDDRDNVEICVAALVDILPAP